VVKTFDLTDDEHRVFAFEVGNTLLTRRKVCKIVSDIDGVTVLREPKVFRLSQEDDETFCEFEVDGVTFEACEPFGDNSRYWIGPKNGKWSPQSDKVREAFVRA